MLCKYPKTAFLIVSLSLCLSSLRLLQHTHRFSARLTYNPNKKNQPPPQTTHHPQRTHLPCAQCSTTCGQGVRTRHAVCVRVQPAVATSSNHVDQQRTRGPIVEDSRCAHTKRPELPKRQRICNKPCMRAQWRPYAWSRVIL